MKQKSCTICKENKSVSNFNKRSLSKDGLQNVCRSCNKKKAKHYYNNNKEKHREETRKRKNKQILNNQERIYTLLKKEKCVDCNTQHFLVLEFDHLRDKKKAITDLVHQGYAWSTIEEEIKKCEIRCRNCHAIKTHEQFKTSRWKIWNSN